MVLTQRSPGRVQHALTLRANDSGRLVLAVLVVVVVVAAAAAVREPSPGDHR